MKTKVGIIGGAGYTAGELIRLLLLHPHVEIAFVLSRSNGGKLISDVHTDLLGDTTLCFSSVPEKNVDLMFLCLGHGEAKNWLKEHGPLAGIKIIDLSQDHRLNAEGFIYGLPELCKENIRQANYIANPGCFATAIQLALLPLAKSDLLKNDIHVNATTGSTGAGQSLSSTSHFSWRQNNMSVYKAFEHQHLAEIRQSLKTEAAIHFIPQRGTFTRGIYASVYTKCGMDEEVAIKLYADFYKDHPFVRISSKEIDLKQIVNTNKCLLHLKKHDDQIFVTACIDNLLKGASGQAVQNMNLMFGWEETTGLKLKGSIY